MKSLDQLTSADLQNIKVLAFDSDGVLVKKGTDITQDKAGNFSQKTNFVSPSVISKLNQLKSRFRIIINSGRSSLYLSQIYQPVLWEGVTLISEVGIFLTGNGYHLQTSPLDKYELEAIVKIRQELEGLIGDSRVKGFEPKQFLTTLHCHSEVKEVNQIVANNDPDHKFYCWWNEEAYDINPLKFTKSAGLNKFLSIHNIEAVSVLTVGNGINDRDLVGVSLNISTDPTNLQTDDFCSPGEEVGGEQILDRLIELAIN